MNTLVLSLLFLLCLLFLVLALFSCIRTYRTIVSEKKERRIRQFAHHNRGKIGEAQQWRCWQCHAVMLSNYEIVRLAEDSVAAVCTLCASSQKYSHIYREGTGMEAPIDSYA